ncbi:MAG: sensor histidine kinase [Ferruginibacter sp.]
MESSYPEIAFAIVAVTIVFLLLSSSVVIYALIYQKRKKQHGAEMTTLKYIYNQELLQTQIEIQEQTFKNISQEIHDNIGQVLSLVKLNLNTLPEINNNTLEKRLADTKQLVSKAITDLRNLSQSLHGDKIAETGLEQAITNELKLLENTGKYQTGLKISGTPFTLDPKKQMIIFRIVQEALNNCVKHAEAKKIDVLIEYQEQLFTLSVKDDGRGFNSTLLTPEQTGIGLKNMHNRAGLIGGGLQLEASPGSGTSIILKLPVRDE